MTNSGSVTTYSYNSEKKHMNSRHFKTMIYDPRRSLLSQQDPLGEFTSCSYDPAGNRLTSRSASNVVTTYSYNGANSLLGSVPSAGAAPTTYSYDAAGNRTLANVAGSLNTFTWDYENRIANLATPAGPLLTNTYDANGLRRSDGTNNYVWDGQNLLQTLLIPSSYRSAQYTNYPGTWGGLVSYYQNSNGPSVFLSYDQSGNTRVATGTSQANTGTFDYQAFGHIFRSTLGAFYVNLYAGQYGYLFFNAAAVPMYYTQARWYDPTTGTWLSRDPIGFDGEDWNLYRYVGNEPVGRVDPSGMAPSPLCLIPCIPCVSCGVDYAAACGYCGLNGDCWRSCVAGINENLPTWLKLTCGAACIACIACLIGTKGDPSPEPEPEPVRPPSPRPRFPPIRFPGRLGPCDQAQLSICDDQALIASRTLGQPCRSVWCFPDGLVPACAIVCEDSWYPPKDRPLCIPPPVWPGPGPTPPGWPPTGSPPPPPGIPWPPPWP